MIAILLGLTLIIIGVLLVALGILIFSGKLLHNPLFTFILGLVGGHAVGKK